MLILSLKAVQRVENTYEPGFIELVVYDENNSSLHVLRQKI